MTIAAIKKGHALPGMYRPMLSHHAWTEQLNPMFVKLLIIIYYCFIIPV